VPAAGPHEHHAVMSDKIMPVIAYQLGGLTPHA
jgi:hypothetical protein